MTDAIQRLHASISKVLFGNSAAIDRVLCCLLARGHLLIEDVPGVGKTVLATALARSLDCTFSRVQLTPDLLPSDILGVSVHDKASGGFTFQKGPVFANIVLADEINRTPPRTQSALLEAMNEATVSVDGKVLVLDPPFMVIATQNPFDFEGTYQLPENQLDRFLMRISLGYPSPEEESRVLEQRPANSPLHTLSPVLSKSEIIALQARVDAVRVDPVLRDYIVSIATATRKHAALVHGLSPRGSLALAQVARARALMRGRDYVIPDDISTSVVPVCAHRVIAKSGSTDTASLLREIMQTIPSPA